jgi:hypothetical protein
MNEAEVDPQARGDHGDHRDQGAGDTGQQHVTECCGRDIRDKSVADAESLEPVTAVSECEYEAEPGGGSEQNAVEDHDVSP